MAMVVCLVLHTDEVLEKVEWNKAAALIQKQLMICSSAPMVRRQVEVLQKHLRDGKIEGKRGGSLKITKPIEQRNTGKGIPNAIIQFGRPLNTRQEKLLKELPVFNSKTSVPKKDVSMKDLAALTANTGCEFAMFTKSGERFIIRGNETMVNIDEETARKLASKGYRWSGHTHPGIDSLSTTASDGDYAILAAFSQARSVVYNSSGRYQVFEGEVPK